MGRLLFLKKFLRDRELFCDPPVLLVYPKKTRRT